MQKLVYLFLLTFGLGQNYSLSFDGEDDYVNISSNPIFAVNDNNLTLSAWINVSYESVGSESIFQGWYGFGYQLYVSNGKVLAVFREVGGNGIGIYGNTDIRGSNWHYVSISLNENNVMIYLDGELDGEGEFINTLSGNGSNNLTIGNSPWASHENYNGLINKISIWDQALMQEQIQSYMITPPTGDESELIGYWSFNAGLGESLYDHSGNGNHGTIYGATWVENIYGCMDELAENYNSDSNIGNCNCDYPSNEDSYLNLEGSHDSYVQIATLGELIEPQSEGFTIEGYVKIDSLPEGNNNWNQSSIIFTTDNNYLHVSVNNDGTLRFFRHSPEGPVCNGTTSINDGQFHHFAAVSENGNSENNFYLFVDGVLECSNIANANFPAPGYEGNYSSSMVYLGVGTNIGAQDFNGDLDEFRISNFVRYTENFELHPGSEESYEVDESTSVFYLFDEFNDSSIVYDYSCNQNHGEIFNATYHVHQGGCTYDLACNYHEEASWNDGSCEYPQEGILYVSMDGDNDNCGSENYSFASIQYAIDIANNGDEVYVSAGTYYENINFNGKDIVLIGEHKENTIIDGSQSGIVVTFNNSETSGAKIKNFTIQNGLANNPWPYECGGGILVYNAGPILEHLIVKNNQAVGGGGGGIYLCNSSSLVKNVNVLNNIATEFTGGIYISSGNSPVIKNSIIRNNSGYQIYVQSQTTDPIIKYNNIENFSVEQFDNTAELSIIEFNIDSDPIFTDLSNEDFTLQSSSPCIDAGDPSSPLDPDGTRADMGAYYFHQDPNVYGCIDESACNYNPEATDDNLNCDYTCYDNGDYFLRFDGIDDWINVSNESITNSDSFLLYTRVKLTDLPEDDSGDPNYNIIDQGNGQWGLSFDENLQKLRFQAKTNSWYSVYADIIEDRWLEVVAIYDLSENKLQLYIDGNLVDETQIVGLLTNGVWAGYPGISINRQANLSFSINKLFISKDLSVIESLINNELVDLDNFLNNLNSEINNNDLVVDYRFNAGSGEILYDYSGYGNHGAINGAAWLENIYGCTDDLACNYNLEATEDDGSCLFFDCTGECGGFIVLDACGECGGNNIACYLDGFGCSLSDECESDFCDLCGECGNTNVGTGDVTGDNNTNISDIIFLIEKIVNTVQFTECEVIVSDVYPDNSINIFDLIILVDIILGEGLARTDALVPTSLNLIQSLNNLSYNTDVSGLIGIELKLEHNIGCEFNLTPDAFIADYKTSESITRMVIIIENGNELFSSSEKFEVTEFIVGSVNGEINTVLSIIPDEYSLSQAYPNPFNPKTTLSFAIPVDNEVTLSIYNLQGRDVATLIEGNMNAGYHSVVWDANAYSSGVYFVKMMSGSYTNTQKLMLIK